MLIFIQIVFLGSAIVVDVAAFCEDSHVVICDDLLDIKNNDSSRWKHLQIGSLDRKNETSSRTLNSGITYQLFRLNSVVIINRIDRIQSPLNVARVTYIRNLNLFKNNLTEIEDYTFKDIPTLREIYLRSNNIHHLGRSIFKNNHLDVVDVSRNHLTSITTCFLESQVSWISVNHNRLTHISVKAFPQNLERLHLDYNLLVTLQDSTFGNLHNLKELSLQHNRLVNLPNIFQLKAIRFLHFSHNRIEAVTQHFDHLQDLEYFDLSYNSIKNISIADFTANKVPFVILSFNRLTDLRFDHPENGTDLVLFGNPWNCDCLFSILRIIAKYKYKPTCDLDYFGKGEFPVCIESGKCGEHNINERDIDDFLVTVKLYSIEQCIFSL